MLETAVVVAQAALAALISVVVFLFARAFRRDPLHLWGFSWAALMVFYASLLVPELPPAAEALSSSARMVVGLWSAYWLLLGTRAFLGRPSQSRQGRTLPLLALSGVAVAMAPWLTSDTYLRAHGPWLTRCLVVGSVYLVCALSIALLGRQTSVGGVLLMGAFFLYGVKLFHYAGVGLIEWARGSLQAGSVAIWSLGDVFLQAAMGLGTVVWLLEREHEQALDMSRRLQRLAYYDPVTELPNRALFDERARAVLRQAGTMAQPVAVLVLDLDHYKKINTSEGHAVGDELLRKVAGRVQRLLAAGDSLARLEGDELALLAPGSTTAQAEALGAQVLREVRKGFPAGDTDIFLTASLGGAVSPRDGVEVEQLLLACDLALARAKRAGGDQLRFFEPAMTSEARARLSFESSLRRALSEDQLELHYQPIWNLKSGRVDVLEALIRWRHPERGLLRPADFLREAERLGLSAHIVPWTLGHACRQAKEWQRHVADLRMAVNLDALSFQRPDLMDEVLAALQVADLSPESLELELTESVAMREPEFGAAMLQRLRRERVTVALDDFGTGYSSLSQLREYPVDALKIDGSFVRDLERSAGARAIVKAIVTLGHSLDLRVVAEGVETAAQRDAVAGLGCDLAQRYFLGPPMPVSGIDRLLDGRGRAQLDPSPTGRTP